MFDVEQNLKLFVQIHEELISAASPKSVTDFCRTIWEFSLSLERYAHLHVLIFNTIITVPKTFSQS